MGGKRPVQQLEAADAALASAAKAVTAARKALATAMEQLQGLGDASLGTEPLGD